MRLRPIIVPVGGFLGAGKTTLILAAAKLLPARGAKPAVILNDQGSALVDTRLAEAGGVSRIDREVWATAPGDPGIPRRPGPHRSRAGASTGGRYANSGTVFRCSRHQSRQNSATSASLLPGKTFGQ